MTSSDVLHSWRSLDKHILKLNEDELWNILAVELAGQKRRLFIIRIFGRANKLRANRELKAHLRGEA